MQKLLAELVGLAITSIERQGDSIKFSVGARQFVLEHEQNCCEQVTLEDVTGDLNDLVGVPILLAEENRNNDYAPERIVSDWNDWGEWTFYRFATIKGFVTLRWFGTSNGCYATDAKLYELGTSVPPNAGHSPIPPLDQNQYGEYHAPDGPAVEFFPPLELENRVKISPSFPTLII